MKEKKKLENKRRTIYLKIQTNKKTHKTQNTQIFCCCFTRGKQPLHEVVHDMG